jgi:exosortase/archaeosortase family protein
MNSVTDESTEAAVPATARKPTIITYEGKKYEFTWNQMLLFVVAAPVFMIVMYLLLYYGAWIRIIVADNTVSSLNFITAMGATISYTVNGITFTSYSALANYVGAGAIFFSYVNYININITIPGGLGGSISFITFCTGFQAIIIFAGLILFTPHSIDKAAAKGIWRRKFWALFWSSAIFYVVNIIRMWIQLYLYHIGYSWDSVHYSISAASSFIAAVIVLLMHRTLPEFVLSIVWSGVEIKKRYFPNLRYKAPTKKVAAP